MKYQNGLWITCKLHYVRDKFLIACVCLESILFFYRIERNGQDGDDPNSIYGGMKMAIEASLDNDSRVVNVEYFYRMFCTIGPKGNINLVHEKSHPESDQHVDPDQLLEDAI